MSQRKSGHRFAVTWLIAVAAFCPPAVNAAEESNLLEDATAAAVAPASSVPVELMKAIRAATFEVVLRKPEIDPLEYQTPLPLELLPFSQRNDKYNSIGTAFAIGPSTFVTAAHVISAASGSMGGTPSLRDAQGNVFAFQRITRYSMHEDFAVFTVTGSPSVAPLPTSSSFQIDSGVIAVGNALGQGIVARDGALTSETPEEQDGRWKWLRFSAPASPGNSGGPLLDAQGKVIGVITRKSANENLNFALPIARVLEAPEGKGSIDVRYSVGVPLMPTRNRVVKLDKRFDLPSSWTQFDQLIISMGDEHADVERAALLKEHAADMFPRGRSGRVLADTYLSPNPEIVTLQTDGRWDIPRANPNTNNTTFGSDGVVWIGTQAGATLFRIRYPNDVDVAKSRGDSKLLGEHLLKGLNLTRPIGTARVRITSLGTAPAPVAFKDIHGRVWQQWRYALPFADTTLMVATLAMPYGYVGFARSARGNSLENNASQMRLLMNYVQAAYSGNPAQWQAFLSDASLRPEGSNSWKLALDPAAEISVQLPRLSMKVDPQVLTITDRSLLTITPGILMEGDKPVWDVLAVQLRADPRGSPHVLAVRRAKPAEDAGQDAARRWQNMTMLTGQFTGNPLRDTSGGWARKVVGATGKPAAEASFLYDLTYFSPNGGPNEVLIGASRLPQMFVVHEK